MIVHQTEISDKLKTLKGVGSPNLTDGVQGVLLKNGSLIATNLTMTQRVLLFENTEESFVISFDAINFIDKLPENSDVEITGDKRGEVTVTCGTIEGKFPSVPPELFPETKADDLSNDESCLRLPAKDVEKYVGQIMYAVPKASTKPILEGVFFDGNGEKINLVACDSVRIAVSKIMSDKKINVVIPREAMAKALSVIDLQSDFIIKDEATAVSIQTGEYVITAKKTDGEFFKYKMAFPKTHQATFKVGKKEMADCLNRSIACYGNEKLIPTVLSGSKGDDYITVENASKKNKFKEYINIEGGLDSDMKIGLNGKLFVEAVKACSDDKVIFQYDNALNPFLVCDSELRQLVLPMRLREG